MVRVSLQLTLARAEAAAADDRWREHRIGCVHCSSAVHRRPSERKLCLPGRQLWDHRADTQATLKREQELERQPIPGQLTLDDVCDLG